MRFGCTRLGRIGETTSWSLKDEAQRETSLGSRP